jgi:GNAT superfamily N-acetyltransferase
VTGWHEEPISKRHNRDAFDCGEEELNEFLRRYARKSHELGGTKTFLAVKDDNQATVLGFYTLCPASVEYARTPEILKRGLARYDVPAFRLARLAVDRSVQGQGLGGQLLLAAGRRCLLGAPDRRQERKGGALVCRLWRDSAAGCSLIAGAAAGDHRRCLEGCWKALKACEAAEVRFQDL